MIPVILIHSGYNDYLNFTISQASEYNDVILLGTSKILPEKCENIPLADYGSGFSAFEKNYVHLNTTPRDYEIFCYKRWFILRDFMRSMGLRVVFYIDSDVLLFADVNKEEKKFKQFDLTLLHRTAAISSFITYRGIDNFCNFLERIYSDHSSYEFKKLASHFSVRQSCGLSGGVCDMTLFELFHYFDDVGGGPGRVGEMMNIIDNSTYDHNINVPDNDFGMDGGIKKIEIIDKIPHVWNSHTQSHVKFNSLHCQGGAKSLIPDIYARCN